MSLHEWKNWVLNLWLHRPRGRYSGSRRAFGLRGGDLYLTAWAKKIRWAWQVRNSSRILDIDNLTNEDYVGLHIRKPGHPEIPFKDMSYVPSAQYLDMGAEKALDYLMFRLNK